MLLDRFLTASAEAHPDKVALKCGLRSAPYAEIEQGANALAHGLLALGLKRQDRVAIQYENSVETAIAIYAALRASGIFVVVNPQVKPDKLGFILSDAGARVLFTSARNAAAARVALSSCPALEHILLCGDAGLDEESRDVLTRAGKSIHALQELLGAHPMHLPSNPNVDLDLASIIYTSGSTGNPKGVMLTHHNMVTASGALITLFGNTPDDVVLSALPLSFNYGLYQALMTFRFGGSLVLEKQFLYPQPYLELIGKERVTGLPIVPTMTAILANLKSLDEFDFSSVRYVTNTAQALPEHHIRMLRTKMPQARIFSMYGLTECKRALYLPPEWIDKKPGSVGIPMPNTEAWLEDDTGRHIDTPGEVGELIVRGTHVMPGYWNRPEENANTLRPGRYPYERELKTGDLFKRDADGHLFFVSRKDDLIKTGGERVGPREVEDAIMAMPEVKEVAVIGAPDEILGSAIKAFVVVKEGAALDAAQVVRFCQARIERYMAPKYVVFLDALPRTATGKISKRELA
ncbi:MAG: AMP-binding protein [Betaproteobacteria bacterium]|nr:AMP-binding protein [Betaproteobacteria bacterium]